MSGFQFGPFRLEPASRALFRDAEAVPLPAKAFDVLVYLVSNPGRLITKEQLLSEVWPEVVVEEGNLTVAVSAIRKALGETAVEPRYVATIKGHGYQFIANVQTAAAPPQPVAPPEPAESLVSRPDTGVPVQQETKTELIAEEFIPESRVARRWGVTRWLPFAAAIALVAVAAAAPRLLTSPAGRTVARFTLQVPPLVVSSLNGIAISPDGRFIVYDAPHGTGHSLFRRAIDQLDATPIRGTEGAEYPFFSPDGRWIGFFTQDALKKVPVDGGAPVTLCPTGRRQGASWGSDGTIVFVSTLSTDVMTVSDSGGTPQTLVRASDVGTGLRWPAVLPGGRVILFARQKGGVDNAEVLVYHIGSKRLDVLTAGTSPVYVSPGYLVFAKQDAIWAAPFDAEAARLTDEPFPVVDQIQVNNGGLGLFGVGRDGSLVALPKLSEPRRSMEWVSRAGERKPMTSAQRYFEALSLSPDGQRLAASLRTTRGTYEIWTLDIGRDVWTRLYAPTGVDADSPTWTADGERLIVSVNGRGEHTLTWMRADGSGSPEPFTASYPAHDYYLPMSTSADGRWLAVEHRPPGGRSDILVYPLQRGAKPQTFLATAADERRPQFSPDGRWIAYQSDESGRPEIYVRPFPAPGGSIKVSQDGGHTPVWPLAGPEILYWSGDAVIGAAISVRDAQLRVAAPRTLFQYPGLRGNRSPFAAVRDGSRLIMIRDEEVRDSALHVVLHWVEELKEKISPR